MRTVLCLLLLVLGFNQPVWARPLDPVVEKGVWYKTTQGCRVWRGKYSPGLVATWNGSCKKGVVHGRGELNYAYKNDGQPVISRYEGLMLSGKPNGRGGLTKPDGTRYVGEFKDGWTHGLGAATYPSGERYAGEFSSGLPHGHGVMIYPTGERHEGGFVHGTPQGHGLVVYPNGDRYEGDIVDGAAHGQGKYTWKKGNSYQGEFFYGLPHGIGQCFAQVKAKGCKFNYGQLSAWL